MELLHDLGIEPLVLLVNMVAFVLVLLLLTKLFFRPFGKLMAERGERIEQEMAEAEQARQQAEQELEKIAEQRTSLAEELAQEAEQRRQQAREEARQILEETRQAAQRNREYAAEQIEREKQATRVELRGETAELVTEITRRALARSLGPEEREQSVEAAIRLVEELADDSRK